MNKHSKLLYLIFAVVTMAVIEEYFTYWPKSIFKFVILFLIPMYLFKLKYNYESFKIKKTTYYWMVFVVVGIIIGYFVVGNFVDFLEIKNRLGDSMSIIKSNFIWIGLYISIVNAGIEEFFFRGIYYLEEGKKRNTWISASAFAIYHLAIMDSWISLPLLILSTVGLFIVALVFNHLTLDNKNIFNSYLVHLSANLTLNALAFFLVL